MWTWGVFLRANRSGSPTAKEVAVSFIVECLRAKFGGSKSTHSSRSTNGSARRGRARRQFESLETRALLSAASGDFNGDGLTDLLVGIPTHTVAGKTNAGVVQILYGSIGHTVTRNRSFGRVSKNISGNSTAGDSFGAALAVGDLNDDRIDDLAIGIPGMRDGGKSNAGGVVVLYGSREGLKTKGAKIWTENSTGLHGAAQAGAHFGAALAAGDFNGDGTIDLAIGAPNKTVEGFSDAGLVRVLYTRRGELRASGDQVWTQDDLGSDSGLAAGNLFGSALAGGDFDADGHGDLAVGVPGEGIDGTAGAGFVNTIYGSSNGLRANQSRAWNAGDLQGIVTPDGQFGISLSTGDLNGDGRSDLAIGSPGANIPSVNASSAVSNAGAVHVVLGSSNGLHTTGNQIFHENTNGISGSAAAGDRFGESVQFGRLTSDHRDDLAIGIPGAKVTGVGHAGALRVLYSNGSALSTTGTQLLNQNTPIVIGNGAASNEEFGSSIAIGDFNADKRPDVAIEVNEGDIGGTKGSVNVLFSSGNQIKSSDNLQWLARARQFVKDTNPETLAERNARLSAAFLAANKNQPGVVERPSGLQYKIISSGSGTALGTENSRYTVRYTGTHIDGKPFDSSADHGGTVTFTPVDVLAGFAEALLLMKEGDHWQIFLPSNLAYGPSGNPPVGPNEALIFDLEIVSIV
jgi:FKBP-type peptidyl-prolyl cis-trans isomerase